MSTLTSILSTDLISNSRSTINTNFGNLNADKVESSILTGSYATTSTIAGTYLQGATTANVLASTLSNVGITPSVQGQVHKVIYKTTNQSVLSSLIQVDNDLKIAVGANEVWAVQGMLTYTGAAVVDLKYGYSVPPGTLWDVADTYANGADYTYPSIFANSNGVNSRNQLGQLGLFSIGSVVGSIALIWAQNTHTPSSTMTMNNNSHLKFDRLA